MAKCPEYHEGSDKKNGSSSKCLHRKLKRFYINNLMIYLKALEKQE